MSAYPHQLSGGMAQHVRDRVGDRRSVPSSSSPTNRRRRSTSRCSPRSSPCCTELQDTTGLAIMLITHDWGVVADIGDRVVVMYAGEVVEQADVGNAFKRPRFPYTLGLLAANPSTARVGSRLPSLPGRVPPPGSWPTGCRFADRCAFTTRSVQDWCAQDASGRLGFAHSVRAHRRTRRAGCGSVMSRWRGLLNDSVAPVLEVDDVRVGFRGRARQPMHFAVDGVSMSASHTGGRRAWWGNRGQARSTRSLAPCWGSSRSCRAGSASSVRTSPTTTALKQQALARTLQAVYQDPTRLAQSFVLGRVEPRRTDACPRHR